ncbi:MAG TPA: RecX family transcriptional regulator [Sphingomicrobium sp.]|nr:RecX family transcriptional regulator [Sphingomicrobium sp.]
MASQQKRRTRPPLTPAKLEEMALSYVGRFATSRAKLTAYLRRKLRERGWDGAGEPPVEQLAERLVGLGYIDDRAYALSKARALTGRGYGERRVRQALALAGINEEQGADARDLAKEEAVAAAIRFARRRSLGPFADREPDPMSRERGLAAMVRAGHRFALARAIIDLKPGENPDFEMLSNMR